MMHIAENIEDILKIQMIIENQDNLKLKNTPILINILEKIIYHAGDASYEGREKDKP